MTKIEWGTKRTCQSCSARFYDLRKSPIVCPKCNATYEPLTAIKGRRGRGVIPDDGKPVLDDLALPEALDIDGEIDTDAAAGLLDDTEDLDEGLDNLNVIEHDHNSD